MSRLKNKLIIVQCSALVFSLSALFVGTYAWYSANRQTAVSVSGITTEQGITISALKYFTHNNDTNGYRAADFTDANVDYSTDFITKTTEGTLFNINMINPGYRYTYAIEITTGFAYTRNIDMVLSAYTSTPSTSKKVTNTALITDSPQGIRLAEAINIYGTSFIKGTTTAELTANNTLVKNFLSSSEDTLSSTDGLVFSYPLDDTVTSFEPKTSLIQSDSPESEKTEVFLITVEFSNATSTYYAYKPYQTDNSIDYYIHDTTGNSNVFKSLLTNGSFSIDNVSLIPSDKS